MRLVTLALLGTAGTFGPGTEAADDRDILYFFFGTESAADAALARAVVRVARARRGKLDVRPVILVEDFRHLRATTEKSPLFQTVRELGRLHDPEGTDIRIYDEEGLRLAAAWKIARLPAAVLVRRDKAHLVQGSLADLDMLFGCDR